MGAIVFDGIRDVAKKLGGQCDDLVIRHALFLHVFEQGPRENLQTTRVILRREFGLLSRILIKG